MANKTEAEIFARLFDPAYLKAEGARSILELDFSADDRNRVRSLAEKGGKGTLTKAEGDELDAFVFVGDLLTIMQSKAWQSVKTGEANRKHEETP
jgi:hypothetical protein